MKNIMSKHKANINKIIDTYEFYEIKNVFETK